jgi:hypothetical protein
MQTYRAAEMKRDSLTQVNKGLRKEIKLAKQENQALNDSLRVVTGTGKATTAFAHSVARFEPESARAR